MAVPPDASWVQAPLGIYATDDTIYFSWWCGASADVVTGCTVTMFSDTEEVFTTNVTSRETDYTWSLRRPIDTLGVTAGNHYTIMVYGYNTEGHGMAASTVVYFYDKPIVTIHSPSQGETITGLPFRVRWSASDETGISSQHIWLLDSHNSIKVNKPLTKDVRTYLLDEASGVVTNNETYRLTLGVTNGVDLSSDAEVRFSTVWTPPAMPSATIEVDEESLSVDVTVVAGEDGDAPATASISVARVDEDGERWVMATDLYGGYTITDPLPPLGVEFHYEVSAFTEAGGVATASVPVTIGTGCWALNCGQEAGLVQVLRYNPRGTWSMEHGGAAYHFADGGVGEGLPVFYPTSTRDQSGTLTFRSAERGDADTLRRRSMTYPVMWVRDPFGHRWRARVVPSYSREVGPYWELSVNWAAVRWEEAW